MTESIGLMEGAQFKPKNEILSWINKILVMNMKTIEQTAPGHVACQIIDIIHPNSVQLSRVKWTAIHEWEFIQNYKILQNSFAKNNIKKQIDVDKLVKAKLQDNLEFMQWMYAQYDRQNATAQDYDALAKRNNQNPPNCKADQRNQSKMGNSNIDQLALKEKTKMTNNKSFKNSDNAMVQTSDKMHLTNERNIELEENLKAKEVLLNEQMLQVKIINEDKNFYQKKLENISEYISNQNKPDAELLKKAIMKLIQVDDNVHVNGTKIKIKDQTFTEEELMVEEASINVSKDILTNDMNPIHSDSVN